MKKVYVIIVLLVVGIGLTGCVDVKLLERVGLATLIGYDLGEESDMETTAIVRQVGTNLESTVSIISTENVTIEGTSSKINFRTAEKYMSGQLRGILFGEELAKEGIGHYIDTTLKNPSISEVIYITVVEGEARPLLEYKYPEITEVGEHIYKLLKQNIDNEQLVSSTLHEVAFDYYSIGRDIAVPIIKRDEELVAISGIAFFDNEKMVGKFPAEDSFYVKLGQENFHAGKNEMKINGDELPSSLVKNPADEVNIVFDLIKTKKKLKLLDPKKPEFTMHLAMQAIILEMKPNMDVADPKKAELLEKAISEKLEREISRVIAHCQELDSDIFGFGEYYRSLVRHSDLTEEKWHDLYQEMKVNVEVDFTLIRSGVFE